jgi:hypothetical protein
MPRFCTVLIIALSFAGSIAQTAECATAHPGVAVLKVSRTTKVCTQCKPSLDVALIEVREPSGQVVWSSLAGPERLSLQAGRWEVTYFCPGIADFEGHQEVVLEPGATYAASCGDDASNYPLKLQRATGAPNNSSKRTR